MERKKQLYQVFHVGGREFSVYYAYYPQMEESYPEYPDFESSPVYTAEGRPFALHVQEGCRYGRMNGEKGKADNCGCCAYFSRENPGDPIGICRKDDLRRSAEKEETRP